MLNECFKSLGNVRYDASVYKAHSAGGADERELQVQLIAIACGLYCKEDAEGVCDADDSVA